MPEVVGPFTLASSSLHPLTAHVEHLRHLNNPKIAREVLCERHGFNVSDAKSTAKILAEYIDQSLAFHEASIEASQRIRSVLQYYCYLNMAVAAIFAFRPPNKNQYRQHGVEDLSHQLTKLELSSTVVKVKRGAVPLFHSILSDAPLENLKFRLHQLLSGFHMVHSELASQFGKSPEQIRVEDSLVKVADRWHSVFKFNGIADGQLKRFNKKRIEQAVPVLTSQYTYIDTVDDVHQYRSKQSWKSENNARKNHRRTGLKIINFGGHEISHLQFTTPSTRYLWHGVPRTNLLPTLTCTLLTSFAFASIARYRPNLVSGVIDSPMQLVHTEFTLEADSVFLPALRNLIYREESAFMRKEFN